MIPEILKAEREICTAAVKRFGREVQLGIAQEECAELVQAISKYRRAGFQVSSPAWEKVIEEMADVEIMLEQLRIALDCDHAVDRKRAEKLTRLMDIVQRHDRAPYDTI